MPLLRYTKLPPPPELGDKTMWQYVSRRSVRRIFFLIVALAGVLFLRRGGGSFGGLFDPRAPGAPTPRPAGGETGAEPAAPIYHLKVTGPRAPLEGGP